MIGHLTRSTELESKTQFLIRSHAMCYGIAGPHGTVKFILQVEYKRLKNVTKTYTLADELFFKVFVEAFGFKLEESGVEEKLKEAN